MAGPVNVSVRSVATSLGVGFAVYYVARGLWWIETPAIPPLLLGALAMYFAMMLTAIFSEDDPSGRMPRWTCILVICAAGLVPAMASLALAPAAREAPFATWYIGATGLLGVVCVVRRRTFVGIGVLAALSASAMLWMGPANALRLGLVGSILWVLVAVLMMWLWARAVHDTELLADVQQRVSAWHASGLVRQRERRTRVQYALEVAGPVLTRVVTRGGDLDEEDRAQARLAEGRLRDELRGGVLLNAAVREAIAAIREAGGTVTLLDESGLDGLDETRREQIRAELVAALRDAGRLRVIIRAPRDERTAVTVVGRAVGGGDEDDVALWREIGREPV